MSSQATTTDACNDWVPSLAAGGNAGTIEERFRRRREQAEGVWTSKLGMWETVEHALDTLAGSGPDE